MNSYEKQKEKTKLRFQKLKKRFHSFFYYGCESDSWLFEVMLLPYVTLQWKSEPTWYRVIGPPGSGKTKHISLLEDHDLTYMIDEFTPKCFISGYRGGGEDPSKLQDFDGKVVIIADESTLMEQRQEDRNLIQSILRRAYDGKVSKVFGNIKEKQEYVSHFNMITCATPQIDRYFLYNQALGERFLNYRLVIPNRERLAEIAYKNQFENPREKLDMLKLWLYNYLDKIPDTSMRDIRISKTFEQSIIRTANFISLVRTHITRDNKGKQITSIPQPESAGRLVQQVTQTAIAFTVLAGADEVTEKAIEKTNFISLGSITSIVIFVLFHIFRRHLECILLGKETWFGPRDLVLITKLGRGSISQIIEDFAIHGLVDMRMPKKQGGRLIEYELSNHILETIQDIGLFNRYTPPNVYVINKPRADRERLKPVERKPKKKKTGKK